MADLRSYADLADPHATALADLREYIGEDMFLTLDPLLREAIRTGEIKSQQSFFMALFMLPVSGYPLVAWYETICKDLGV